MFLKSIEIRGFKSFADKTDLNFLKGITSVVGPNGSGKSNISDAVRWVLGEQSVKSLRGGKMEDVIFAGTQYRKPVGLAQVSLTLDNSDSELQIEYSDVTISRRLYRSGESEYYINNTQCRLKDIQELFMDTGIGKEGYSIIGQGKIDAILSGRPEERRSLLEEAAGIVKFKSRKEDAEKKLQNTEQNLVRICDIIKTFEDRLEPLSIESDKAKTFLVISEDLKQKEVNLIVNSINGLQTKISTTKTLMESIQSDVANLTYERTNARSNLDILTAQLEACDNEIDKNQQVYFKSKSEHQVITSDTNLLKERINNLNLYIEKNNREIDDLNTKLDNLISLKDTQDANLIDVQAQQININNDIKINEDEIIKLNSLLTNNNSNLDELKESHTVILTDVSNLKNRIIILKSENQQLSDKIEELKITCENTVSSIKINSGTQLVLEKNISDISIKITSFEEEFKKSKTEIIKLNNTIAKDESVLKELTLSSSKLEANFQMLMNFEKQYEGYNRAVKLLMQDVSSGKIPNLKEKCFILGEIINVSKNHETAIEIALGSAISDVVTNDEVIAKNLIDYLKKNNMGRATFLPLSIIKGKKIINIDTVRNLEGFIGIASDIISYDQKFSKAVEYVLGRTLVASNMDSALNIAKLTGYSYKIVTLSGEVINPGGALTGGSSYHKSTSIISRKREIDELKETIKVTKIKIDEINILISSNKAKAKSLDDNCLNIKDEIYRENIEIAKLKEKVNNIINENDRLTKYLETSRNELHGLKDSIAVATTDICDEENKLQELIEMEQRILSEINEAEAALKDKNQILIQTKESYTSLKIKKAQIDEIVLGRIRELERISKEIEDITNKRYTLADESKTSKENILLTESEIQINTNKLSEIEKSITDLENVAKEKEIEKIKVKNLIKVSTEELERLSMIINKKEDEVHRHEVSLAKVEADVEGLYNRLNEEYMLTYAEALKYNNEITNLEKHKSEISQLKNQIASLGMVNVGAIEEYKEVKEKYTFMNSQKEDLIGAKNELQEMINEMTLKMKSVFSENLEKLRVVFNETFKELFKGGRADLILAEGDELTANIEINVEPPGKKLQNINLMSGGEKVLSAIALLFAILKMKPTPFCILDEIEAALDDANVLRYAEFLRKFSSNIQFIVITHRKGTMEVSDVLYGVTMEEKGISKVVSVDLNKQPALIR
jgi:chromosome segregation protein